jgi:hypothetical protein
MYQVEIDLRAECHAVLDHMLVGIEEEYTIPEAGYQWLYMVLLGLAFSSPENDTEEQYEAATNHLYNVGQRIHEEELGNEEQV